MASESSKQSTEEVLGNDEESDCTVAATDSSDLVTLLSSNLNIDTKPEQLLPHVDFDGVIEYILSGKARKIVTMAGAGISTSAGIPDFRSPDTGLYANLQKYDIPNPTAIFTIDFFLENPKPFFTLAKELWPGTFKPTPSHFFIKLLSDKGLLLRHYTQNIDTLERVAGIDPEKIVEAHGTFHSSHCLGCQKEYSQDWIKERIFGDVVPTCDECNGIVKPDIVFFGEALPSRFASLVYEDLKQCDMLIIMGTSLTVQPFASLASRVQDTCPRLYINREKADQVDPFLALLMGGCAYFKFDSEDNYRDVFLQGDCDDGCLSLAEKLGWKADLRRLIQDFNKKTSSAEGNQSRTADSKNEPSNSKTSASAVDSKLSHTPKRLNESLGERSDGVSNTPRLPPPTTANTASRNSPPRSTPTKISVPPRSNTKTKTGSDQVSTKK